MIHSMRFREAVEMLKEDRETKKIFLGRFGESASNVNKPLAGFFSLLYRKL